MERLAAGDQAALATLIRRHQRLVTSIAYRFLGDRFEAEDVAQEVFLRLWHAARRYRPETSLGAYLRRITVNYCLDLRRKPRLLEFSRDLEAAGPDDLHADIEMRERQRALDGALQSLPSSQRMAVILFHMENLSVKEVAELLETSPKAAESLLSRARATLRERLSSLLL